MNALTTFITSVGLLATLTAGAAEAAEKRNEAYYAERWCAEAGGREEVTLPSGARADCITEEFAVEVDWSNKWAEGLGQAMHYASETGKRAAVVLLIHEKSKNAEIYRLESTIAAYGVDVQIFVVEAPKRP